MLETSCQTLVRYANPNFRKDITRYSLRQEISTRSLFSRRVFYSHPSVQLRLVKLTPLYVLRREFGIVYLRAEMFNDFSSFTLLDVLLKSPA